MGERRFEEQIKAEFIENYTTYDHLVGLIHNAQEEINKHLEAAGHPGMIAVDLGEFFLECISFSPQGRLLMNTATTIPAFKRLITLYNVVFRDTGFQPRQAMGYKGPDESVVNMLGSKLKRVNQTKWLWSHSGMKIPSKEVMQRSYIDAIWNAPGGYKLGKYRSGK